MRKVSRIQKICKECNKPFEIERWRLKDSSRGQFCSVSCRGKQRGDRAWNWRGGIPSRNCGWCNTIFTPISRSKNTYCNKDCRASGMKERQSGTNSPSYKHGKYAGRLYGTTRYEQWRSLVINRDNYICQSCGLIGEKNKGIIHADHIRSIRLDPANSLNINNGQALCKDCHIEKSKKDLRMILMGRKLGLII